MLVSNKVPAQTLSQFSETFKADHEVLSGELPVPKIDLIYPLFRKVTARLLIVNIVCQLHAGMSPILRLLSAVDQ